MIEKIISEAQTGADQAGLIAAEKMGLLTGGTIPKGCKTLSGPNPQLLKRFNLKESESSSYPVRTEQNVIDSDGTIRFAKTFSSPGERCTFRAINKHLKPCFDVDLLNPPPHDEVVEWVLKNKIRVLNVAGNSEQTAPGIEKFVVDYLVIVINKLKVLTDGQKRNTQES